MPASVRYKDTGQVVPLGEFGKKQRSDPRNSHLNGSDEDVANSVINDHPELLELVSDGSTGSPKGIVSRALDFTGDAIKGIGSAVGDSAVDIGRGMSATIYKPVANIAKATGHDPKAIRLPGTFTEIPSFLSDPSGFRGGETLQDAATTPDSISGKVGNFVGETAQIVGAGRLLKGLPQAAATAVPRFGKLAKIGTQAALDSGLASAETLGQSGDVSKAEDAAIMGAAFSPIAVAAGNRLTKYFQDKSVRKYLGALSTSGKPLPGTVPEMEQLAKRGLNEGDKISEEGFKSAHSRWTQESTALRAAANKATSKGAIVTPDIIENELSKIEYADPKTQEASSRVITRLMGTWFPDGQPITPDAAEKLKTLLNTNFKDLFDKTATELRVVTPNAKATEQVYKKFTDGLRKAIGEAVDSTHGPITFNGKTYSYRELAKLSSVDYELADHINNILTKTFPDRPTNLSYTAGAALSSLLHGRFTNPAEMAMAAHQAESAPRAASRSISVYAKTKAPPIPGKAAIAAMALTPEGQSPTTEPTTVKDKNGKDIQLNILDRY